MRSFLTKEVSLPAGQPEDSKTVYQNKESLQESYVNFDPVTLYNTKRGERIARVEGTKVHSAYVLNVSKLHLDFKEEGKFATLPWKEVEKQGYVHFRTAEDLEDLRRKVLFTGHF